MSVRRCVGSCLFFFKQKTAYEMRISDWSSEVCSSDLKLLADHQFVQGMIADSALELEQFRLLILKTAWMIDNQPHGAARMHIGMCKMALAKVYHDIAQRAVHLHGALGTSRDTPLAKLWMGAPMLAEIGRAHV